MSRDNSYLPTSDGEHTLREIAGSLAELVEVLRPKPINVFFGPDATPDQVEVAREQIESMARPIDRKRLAHAILDAAGESGRRPTSDGFEWYASADDMADAIIAALDAIP